MPSGYERRRAKARIEKTARVKGYSTITRELAKAVIDDDVEEFLKKNSGPASALAAEDGDEALEQVVGERRAAPPWTADATERLNRVPEGFMREMTRARVLEFAKRVGASRIDLAIVEEGIAEGRRIMSETISRYQQGGEAREAAREALGEANGS